MTGKLENALSHVVVERKPILGNGRRKHPTEEKNVLELQELRKVATLKNAQVQNTPFSKLSNYIGKPIQSLLLPA